MTYKLNPVSENFLAIRTKRLTTLWRIIRQDGTKLHFTTHDTEIPFDAGQLDNNLFAAPEIATYTPIGGFDSSAKRKELGLRESNTDFRGVLNAAAITIEDLRVGKYRNAVLDEFVIDHRYPFNGRIIHNKWVVQEISQDGNLWTATVGGLAHKLRQKTGELYSRECPFDVFAFGGVRNCRKVRAPGYFFEDVTIFSIANSRSEFTATPSDIPTDTGIDIPDATGTIVNLLVTDGFFTFGKIKWTTGKNAGAGIVSNIREHTHLPHVFKLRLRTPFDILITDTFEVEAGCDKKKQTCILKFDNLNNHGAFSFLTEPQETVRGPIAQT